MQSKYFDIIKEKIKYSYSPYSGYKVGAMLITDKGRKFFGFNIENASYSLTVCAERTAVFNALTNGEKNFRTLYIYAKGKNLPYPCGACLQVLSEFVKENFEINISNGKTEKSFIFKDLMPKKFNL